MDVALMPGSLISGRFRLERLLGRGGMGTVWEAHHLALDTRIAIKFLNSDVSFRHDIRARFSREATSAARIRSQHVVGILDSGFTDEGHAFIAMELLRGEDLGRRLTRLRRLSVPDTSTLVTQVARGLAKAHAVGIVHRDLKPENLFLVDEESAFTVKILDFGIAKAFGTEAATHKTDTGQLLGTPRYMSPEQALGRAVDQRTDLYSLTVVAFRCLTGALPFTYSAVGEQIVAVSTFEPPPPSRFNPSLPPSVDEWFAQALKKDPNARTWQDARSLAEAFEQVCSDARNSQPVSAGRHSSSRFGRSVIPVAKDVTEAPSLSNEELATTVLAAQPPVAPSDVPRKPWYARAKVLAAGVGLGALAAVLLPSTRRSHSSPSSTSVAAISDARSKPVALTSPAPPPKREEAHRPLQPSVATALPSTMPSPPQKAKAPRAPAAAKASAVADAGLQAPNAAAASSAVPSSSVKLTSPPIDRENPW